MAEKELLQSNNKFKPYVCGVGYNHCPWLSLKHSSISALLRMKEVSKLYKQCIESQGSNEVHKKVEGLLAEILMD
jgi:hypothetical protein